MEAEPTKIPLKGIERNTPDATCEDGAMDNVVNLRYKDGAYRPVGEAKKVLDISDGTEKIYVHRNNGYEHWIRICGDNGTRLEYFGDTNANGTISNLISPKIIYSGLCITDVSFIGNVICFITDGINKAIWFDSEYKDLGNSFELPTLQFNIKPIIKTSDEAKTADGLKGQEAAWNKMFGLARNDGLLNGITFVRYALKLYDGTYISHSNIVAVQPPLMYTSETNSFHTRLSDGVHHGTVIELTANNGIKYEGIFYELYYKGYNDVNELKEFIEKYKSIISSIDIFISKSISYYRIEEQVDDHSIKRHFNKKGEELLNEVGDIGVFYKAHSIEIEKLSSYSGNIGEKIELKDILNSMEATNDTLPDDSNSHDRMIPNASFVYNSKLHIGDIEQIKFKGFNVNSYITKNSSNLETKYNFDYEHIVTRFNISGKKVEVANTVISYEGNVVNNHSGYFLDTFIMYPDSNAYEIEFIRSGADGKIHSNTYKLTKSKMLNMAYYCDNGFGEISGGGTGKILTNFSIENYVKRENASYYRGNVLKVSKVNNPFVFAAENTYTCGNGNILGIDSLIGEVSSGTSYGTFPLYVFCSDGIKMLETGTSDVYYTNTSDASKEVCSNSDSITSTPNGVVFTTNRGLMIINGTEVQEISSSIEGKAIALKYIGRIRKALLCNDGYYKKYFANLRSVVDDNTTFLDFLKTSQIGYNYKENELYIYKGSLYYVYNMYSNTWSKRTIDYNGSTINCVINSYPNIYILKKTDTNNPDGTIASSKLSLCNANDDNELSECGCLLLTRPIKLGTDGFKKATRAVLRGNFIMPNVSGVSNGAIRFLVYGSIDCMTWYLIGGTDNNNINAKDIGSTLYRYKARYYRFAFIGKLNAGTQINYLEIAADERLGNKIR